MESRGKRKKRRFRFTGTPGVKNFPNGEFTPINVFKLFLTDELVQHITDATNSYAQIIIDFPEIQERIENTKKSLFRLWQPVTFDEMWTYIAVTMLMGIIKKPELHLYWSNRHIFSTPIFPRLMRRDRYEQIRKMIHFTLIENSVLQ